MIIVGIDPGTAIVGYSFIEGTRRDPKILEYGILKTAMKPRELLSERLLEIGNDIASLLGKYRPERAVVEDLFFYNNQKTAISVAQARGVLLYQLAKHNVEIISLTPLQIKQGLSGYGRAEKKQIQTIVKKIYNLESMPTPDDAADSLGMAWLGLKQ